MVDFAVPTDHRVKLIWCEKKDKYRDLTRELKKNVDHEKDSDTNSNWCFLVQSIKDRYKYWRTWK